MHINKRWKREGKQRESVAFRGGLLFKHRAIKKNPLLTMSISLVLLDNADTHSIHLQQGHGFHGMS